MAEAPLTKAEIELIKRYQAAQVTLINIIATTKAKGNVTAYRRRLLTSVNQELRLLNEYAESWAKEAIPKAYAAGAAQTYAAFRASKVVVDQVALNTKVVDLLVKNSAGMLIDANNFVGRTIKDNVRKASIEAVGEKVATGSTVKQAQANLIKKLSDKGVVALKDKAGRMINLDSYANTVARSTTREATNRGVMQTVQDAGYDLVKMSQHFTACPICSKYEGRVYSISGKSKIYPAINVPFSGDHANIHPNCRHVLVPYFPDLDDNAAKMVKESNRDFKTDPRDKASIEKYNEQQAKKTKRRNKKNAREKAKLEESQN